MKIREEITQLIKEALLDSFPQINEADSPEIEIDLPKDKAHGDFSTNVAMKLARTLKMPPVDIARSLRKSLEKKIKHKSCISHMRIENIGFINFFLKEETYYQFLISLLRKPRDVLSCDIGRGERIQIEFVSANPTGPLSVAHGRQAAVGESLSRIFKLFNFKVSKEYYLNDEGNQINLLGASILARLAELKGEPCQLPQGGYAGAYIKDIARRALETQPRSFLNFKDKKDESGLKRLAANFGLSYILNGIKEDLKDFGIRFDVWYSQKALGTSGKIEKALKFLKDKGYTYEKDGALWFKSTNFGDDKDRVLIKSDGSFTYITPDIAYHEDKFRRKFTRVINIWGPDHHGYISRLLAAVAALGVKRERISIIIVQLARIFRAGRPLAMSTRMAQYITLREVLDEVGRDVAKFFFLTRRTDSHLDFDLELAKRKAKENPVYYIQYAYARIAGVFNIAREKKIANQRLLKIDFSLLNEKEEKQLMRLLLRFPFCLENCLRILDPYPICQYLIDLAAEFHRYYDRHKILIEDNPSLTNARMALIKTIATVLSEGLQLLAIDAPQRM